MQETVQVDMAKFPEG